MSDPLLAEDFSRIGPPSAQAIPYLPDRSGQIGTMRSVAPTVTALLNAEPPRSAERPELDTVVETLTGTQRLAHIVIDAFGVATWQCHRDVTPTINRLASIRQLELQSVLPAITPVNFSTIATGASPQAHRITDRNQQLTLDTTFARLADAGLSTATCAQRLSTVGILLSPHSQHPTLASSNSDEEVASLFCELVTDEPDYILTHLLDVDNAGHRDGPWGQQTRDAVASADSQLRQMIAAMVASGYALMLHADHGQHDVTKEDGKVPAGMRGTHSGLHEEDVRVPFIFVTHGELQQVVKAS